MNRVDLQPITARLNGKRPCADQSTWRGLTSTETDEGTSESEAIELFKTVMTIFPKHRELYPTPAMLKAARRIWVLTLAEQRISGDLIEHGLRAARSCGWTRPPAAGLFCQWAIEGAATAAGIPTVQQAQAAIMARLRNPHRQVEGWTFHILTELDWYSIKRSGADEVMAAVATAHASTIEHWRAGGQMRRPAPVSVEDQSKSMVRRMSPEAREVSLAALRALQGR